MRWICSYGRLYRTIYDLIIGSLIFFFSMDSIAAEKYVVTVRKDLVEKSYDIMMGELGLVEKSNQNDGAVQKYLAIVGLKGNNPYCAAGQFWCFVMAAKNLKIAESNIPIPKTGLANNIYNYFKKNGTKSPFRAELHDLIIWRKGSSAFGHIERVIQSGKAGWVKTVGFNVREIPSGKQGVFIKKRNLYYPLLGMKLRGIAGFRIKG